MKRIHWWTLTGVSGTGLAALLLGQSVLGQPDLKVPLPTPPIAVVQPERPVEKSVDGKAAPEGTTGTLPRFESRLPPELPMPVVPPFVIESGPGLQSPPSITANLR